MKILRWLTILNILNKKKGIRELTGLKKIYSNNSPIHPNPAISPSIYTGVSFEVLSVARGIIASYLRKLHSEIINNHDKLNVEVSNYRDIHAVFNVTQQQVHGNYYQVKMEVERLIGVR